MTDKLPKEVSREWSSDPTDILNNNDINDHLPVPWYLGTFFTNFMAGAVSSVITETTMAPFERVKLLLQLQKMTKNYDKGLKYKGVFATFKRIHTEQGFFSFWRGHSANLLRSLPYQALNFSLKDKFREIFHKSMDVSIMSNRILANLTAGGLAGSCALSVIYPFDYARTRLAVETGTGNNREFKTVWQTLSQTYKSDGRLGLYRGFYCSIIGVFVYRSVYFGTFDTWWETIPQEHKSSFWIEFIIADLASVSASTVAYPFDTVRRIMMMQSGSNAVKNYLNYSDCYKKIYRKYGFQGFYHGGFINVVRGLGGGLMLITYEKVQDYFISLNPNASKVSGSKSDNQPLKFSYFNCPT